MGGRTNICAVPFWGWALVACVELQHRRDRLHFVLLFSWENLQTDFSFCTHFLVAVLWVLFAPSSCSSRGYFNFDAPISSRSAPLDNYRVAANPFLHFLRTGTTIQSSSAYIACAGRRAHCALSRTVPALHGYVPTCGAWTSTSFVSSSLGFVTCCLFLARGKQLKQYAVEIKCWIALWNFNRFSFWVNLWG